MQGTRSIASLKLLQVCGYNAAASWSIIFWDGLLILGDEIEYIWPMPNTGYIKWLYFFGKYFALALQTVVLGIEVGYFPTHGLSVGDCRIYRIVEMVASVLLMLDFDIVLLLRIYALYGRRTWSSTLGTMAVILEFVTTLVCSMAVIPTTSYDSACAIAQVPKAIMLFAVGTMISQSILLWLAYRRRSHVIQSRSSLACITIRDGLLVFVCVAAFLIVIFFAVIYNSPITTVTIFWIPVVSCVATSRLILNLQRARDTGLSRHYPMTTEVWGVYGSADSFLLSDVPYERGRGC